MLHEFHLDTFFQSGALFSLSADRLLIGWGEPRKSSIPNEPAFFFSDFFLQQPNPWIQYPFWAEVSFSFLKNQLIALNSVDQTQWTLHHPERFKSAFAELMLDLQDNRLQKAVPYLFIRSPSLMNDLHLGNSIRSALVYLEKFPCTLYGHWHNSQGVLGLTPELLFEHDNCSPKKISTMALAGTHPTSHNLEVFVKDKKELYEHDLVIQGIRQALAALGAVSVKEMQIVKLPLLCHLMTPIELELQEPFQFDALVLKLHPTPALGAFPFQEGKQWLEKFNLHTPRHYYGAPVGFRNPQMGISRCYSAIRNVQWDAHGMRIGAGVGVVKTSLFEKEWSEIVLKMRTTREQLQL